MNKEQHRQDLRKLVHVVKNNKNKKIDYNDLNNVDDDQYESITRLYSQHGGKILDYANFINDKLKNQ